MKDFMLAYTTNGVPFRECTLDITDWTGWVEITKSEAKKLIENAGASPQPATGEPHGQP